MEVEFTDRLRALVNKVAQDHGIDTTATSTRITTAPATAKGDNFIGIITRVTITDSTSCLKLIMKSAACNDDFRELAPIAAAFEREIYFYTTVVSAYDALLIEHGLSATNNLFPRLFGSDMHMPEVLIMNDIKAKGFVMKSRGETLNLQHVKLVMSQYGRFHGLYYALKSKRPELCAQLTTGMRENFFHRLGRENPMWQSMMNNVKDRVLKALGPEDEKARHRFTKYTKDMHGELLSRMTPEAPGRFGVLTHGDSWLNNMLFKYKNSEEASEVCFLDFQMARFGSPAMDLSYFIYTCTDQALRDQHFAEIMHTYHEAMRDLLRTFTLDANDFLTPQELDAQMQRFALFGIYMAVDVVHLMLSDPEELPEFQELKVTSDIDESMSSFGYVSKNEEKYNDRIRDVILDSVARNYL